MPKVNIYIIYYQVYTHFTLTYQTETLVVSSHLV